MSQKNVRLSSRGRNHPIVLVPTAWKLWDLKSGEARSGASTLEAREVLERAMTERRRRGELGYAGQLHFYIHLVKLVNARRYAAEGGFVL